MGGHGARVSDLADLATVARPDRLAMAALAAVFNMIHRGAQGDPQAELRIRISVQHRAGA